MLPFLKKSINYYKKTIFEILSNLSKCLIFQLALSCRVAPGSHSNNVQVVCTVHEIPSFVNFVEADDFISCGNGIIIRSPKMWGNVSLQKKSNEQNYGGN